MTTWRTLIQSTMDENKDEAHLTQMINTLSQEELDIKFDNSFGGLHGKPFLAYSPDYVYFPIMYDGAEWAGSAPRHPHNQEYERREPLNHQGGGG